MEKRRKIRPDLVLSSGMFTIGAMMILCIIFYMITGAEGVGYLSAPVALFLMGYGVLIISFETVTRDMMRIHLTKGHVKEAQKKLRQLMLVGFGIGAGLALLCALFSSVFANMVFHSSRSFYVLLVVAPVLLFMSIQGVLRGYLSGAGFISVSLFSNVIMVVVTYVLFMVFSGISYKYGLKVNALMHVEDIASAYGAIGAAFGISVSCLVSLLFLVIMSLIKRRELNRLAENSIMEKATRYNGFMLELIPMWLIMGSGGLLLFIDECVYMAVANSMHSTENNIENWGIYIGQCFALTVLILFLSAIPFAKSWFSVKISIVKRDFKAARAKIQNLMHFEAMLIFPLVIWVMVLSGTITALMFGKTNVNAVNMIVLTLPIALPGAFLLFQTFLLVQLKNNFLLTANAVLGIVVHLVILIIMSTVAKLGIHASMAAFFGMILVQAVLGFFELKVMLDYKQEIIRNLLKPLLAAGVSGLLALLLDRIFVNLIGEVLTLLIAIILSYLLYMVLLILLKSVNRYEIERMPFGDYFALLADRWH